MRSKSNLIGSFIEVGLHSFYELIQLSFVLPVITDHYIHAEVLLFTPHYDYHYTSTIIICNRFIQLV